MDAMYSIYRNILLSKQIVERKAGLQKFEMLQLKDLKLPTFFNSKT